MVGSLRPRAAVISLIVRDGLRLAAGGLALVAFALTFVLRRGAPMETAELPAPAPGSLAGDTVSIVIPVYNEEANLRDLVARVGASQHHPRM